MGSLAPFAFVFCLVGISANHLFADDVSFENDHLKLTFAKTDQGVQLTHFLAKGHKTNIIPHSWGSFFGLWLGKQDGASHVVTSDQGWGKVQINKSKGQMTMIFSDHIEEDIKNLRAKVHIEFHRTFAHWTMDVDVGGQTFIDKVEYPVITPGPLGSDKADDRIHYPLASGVVKSDPYSGIHFLGHYPSGFEATYQLMGLFDPSINFYLASHDPTARTKRFWAQSHDPVVKFSVVWPGPHKKAFGQNLTIDQPVVTGIITGDWFDAAITYRHWAQQEAPWWPKSKRKSKLDDVAVWAQASGDQAAHKVIAFAKTMDVPVGVHWYNWHQIPFDDDYPHYFPARKNFRAQVKHVQQQGLVVMPYINGRLWDTDLESFKTKAKASATKDAEGNVFIEQYGGNGQKLAPMCPVTPLWRTTLKGIIDRLIFDFKVDGVYLDQVAASLPVPCMDPNHNHPLGHGNWWIDQGYRPLLKHLKTKLPSQTFLTSECNGEGYTAHMDGYLTWQFQHQDQQPIYAAIYSGASTLFGRAHKGGPTSAQALRTRLGQALVFGEQLGWFAPSILHTDPTGTEFLQRLAKIRHNYRRFFQGTMGRPPKVFGTIPTVTTNWYWLPDWEVTLPILQKGRWLNAEGEAISVFVNISSKVPVHFKLDAEEQELSLAPLQTLIITEKQNSAPFTRSK